MRNRIVVILFLIVLASLGGVLVSQRKLALSLEKKTASAEKDVVYKKYIAYMFSTPFSGEELTVLDSLTEREPARTSIIVPENVCRSCFFSLFQFLYEMGIRGQDVVVYLTGNDEVSTRELKRWRYEDIRHVEMPGQEGMTDILLARIANNGWQQQYMKYQDGYERVVYMFLRE